MSVKFSFVHLSRSVPVFSLHSSVMTETRLGSVYNAQSQAKLTVNHDHEMSTFQHDLQCVMSRCTRTIHRRPC